jgi:hypothetical protein
MERNNEDIITKTISHHIGKENGVGSSTLFDIADELKAMYSIEVDLRSLDRRIKDYMGTKFSS